MARQAIDATDSLLDEPLSDDLAANLQELAGRDDPAETVGDWVEAIREAVRADLDRELSVDDLCHVDGGEHVTRSLDEDGDVAETYHFACFYDGLVLAGMEDRPVLVETTCAETGETVTFDGTLDDLRSDAAVVSLGVANDPRSRVDGDGDGELRSFALAYGATCPYVKAFASRDAYESWRAGVDAATVGISPAVALAAARELAA